MIDHGRLEPGHPLIRPIENNELQHALNSHKNTKAPGPSGIKAIQIKNLPLNIIQSLKDVYDSMLCTKYFPAILIKINMIFHSKQQDPTNPLNYRPISLLETLCKTFEKIITNRLNYYYEHHR